MTRFRKTQVLAISAVLAIATVVGTTAGPAFAETAEPAAGSALAGVLPDNVKECDSSTVNWAATYPSLNDWFLGRNATNCIGDKGTWKVGANRTAIFCAGNNQGTVWYTDLTTGGSASHTFWPDTSYYVSDGTYKEADPDGTFTTIDTIDVYQVQITGWSGSAGC